jgi:hypothetical protein
MRMVNNTKGGIVSSILPMVMHSLESMDWIFPMPPAAKLPYSHLE